MTTPAAPDNGSVILPLTLLGIGGYLAWFAIHYWRGTNSDGSVMWPSDPIKSALQGNGLPANTPATAATAALTAYETGLAASPAGQAAGSGPGGPGGTGTTGGQGPQPSGAAQNTAKLLLAGFPGWAAQWGDLVSLWDRESGWSNTAWNPSGAYGVAQALGHAKPGECATGPRSVGSSVPGQNCSYGSEYGLTPDQARAANAGNLLQQIRWGLGYIKATYGGPSAAWRHETSSGWY